MPAAAKSDAEFLDRFWSRVDKSGDCWEWQGHTGSAGHGQVKRDGNLLYVHRLSYELAFGTIPDGLCVCHRCDNPRCVNPEHFFLGTRADNMRDMWLKGRQRPVTKVAKVTPTVVREIRRIYAAGGVSQATLAERFGVSQMAISNIVTRTSWGHVD